MESSATLQERRKLNEEIERAFIQTTIYARDIQVYHQTERGVAIIDLYEGFYSSYSYLVMLTSDLKQLKQSSKEIDEANAWINQKSKLVSDKDLLVRCDSGVSSFIKYKRVLSDQGVIALPTTSPGR
jgi:DNA-binding SARP family transcriptional activator